MSSTTMNIEVRNYIAALEGFLDDLPENDRRELLEDLEQHIAEVAAEGDGSLEGRLGSPETYAAELRISAGLPARKSPPRLKRLRRAIESTPARAVRDFLPELRPGWWVLRGYLLAVAIFTLAGDRGEPTLPGLRAGFGGLIVATMCIVGSVWLGRLAPQAPGLRWVLTVVNVAAAVLGLWVFSTLGSDLQTAHMETFVGPQSQPAVPGFLAHGDGSPISNICAYDSKGKPYKHVVLFDQDGRPIDDVAGAGRTVTFDRVTGKVIAELSSPTNVFPRKEVVRDRVTGAPTPFKCPELKK